MARPLRIMFPGAVYLVSCYGNDGKNIFKNDRDRTKFIELLDQSAKIYRIKVYGYVLLSDHFHLLIETPTGNLSEFMRHFNITYTSYFNRINKRLGHLYRGRYKSILVDKSNYLSMISRYIHLNPIRVNTMKNKPLKEKERYLKDYKWSSLPGYISKRVDEEFIDYQVILDEYKEYSTNIRNEYKKRLLQDMKEDLTIKDKIIGQTLLGRGEFIGWVRKNFLEEENARECPSCRDIMKFDAKEKILKAIKIETGKSIEEIQTEKGYIRQISMDLLYREGGLSGSDVGNILGVDYSTVSQERKRLRERMQRDEKVNKLMGRIEHQFFML